MRHPSNLEEALRLAALCRQAEQRCVDRALAYAPWSKPRSRWVKAANRLLSAETFYYFNQWR